MAKRRPIRWFAQFGGVYLPGSWQAWLVLATGVAVIAGIDILVTVLNGGRVFH